MRNKIKELRKQIGLRQEDMTKELGVTRQTINAVENGKYNPTLELAMKLAKLCKECNRQVWGTTNQSKRCTFERNQEIFNKYMSGISVETLAEEYFLSVKTIYGIVAKMKR